MSSPLTKTLGSREAPALVLVRLGGGSHDVAGVLNLFGRPIAVTLELAWRDNERSVSCIPLGVYRCRRVNSPTHGDTFEVLDVDGRSAILFHVGNKADDSRGCILLGAAMGVPRENGARTVMGSRIARDRFLAELEGVTECWLSVTTLPDVSAVIDAMVKRVG